MKIICNFEQPFSIFQFSTFLKMSKNLIFIGIAAIAWIAFKKINFAKKINTSLNNFRFTGGNFLIPKINVELLVNNPTNTSADIQKISANIFLQNKMVGTIYKDINQTIQKNDKTIINFDALLNLGEAATILIQNKFKNQQLKIEGNLIVDFVYIPFNYSINLF